MTAPTELATSIPQPTAPAGPAGVEPLPAIDISDEALARVGATLASTAEKYDRSGEFPWAGVQAVHDAGLLRLGIDARATAVRACRPPTACGSSKRSARATRPSR